MSPPDWLWGACEEEEEEEEEECTAWTLWRDDLQSGLPRPLLPHACHSQNPERAEEEEEEEERTVDIST